MPKCCGRGPPAKESKTASRAQELRLLRVDDTGQGVVALRSAKQLLLIQDGAQTVAERRFETAKVAQLGIQGVGLTVPAFGPEFPNFVANGLAVACAGIPGLRRGRPLRQEQELSRFGRSPRY